MNIEKLTQEALELLKNLIKTQSFSSEEEGTASFIENWFNTHDIPFQRQANNIWATNKNFKEGKMFLK